MTTLVASPSTPSTSPTITSNSTPASTTSSSPPPTSTLKVWPLASSHYGLPVPVIVGIVAAGVLFLTALTLITVVVVCVKHRKEKRAKAEKALQAAKKNASVNAAATANAADTASSNNDDSSNGSGSGRVALPEMVVVQPEDVTDRVLEAGEGGADKVIHMPVDGRHLKIGNRRPSPMVLERMDPQDAMRDERGFLKTYKYWNPEL